MPVQKKERRPRISEMDRIDTKLVRSNVTINDQATILELKPGRIRLELIWNERKGGTFGPGSAAFANRLRRGIRNHAVQPYTNIEDRGNKAGFILYFKCPNCSRRCRVLYSKKDENMFGCIKCNRPAYESNSLQYTGRRNARGISLHERERIKNVQAATKIRQQIHARLKRQTRKNSELLLELTTSLEIHEKLADLASMRSTMFLLHKI